MNTLADLRELYFTFGITAQKAQVMETSAGNVALAFASMFINKDNITPELTEWFKDFVDDINSKTFGALLRVIKKSITIDDHIISIIDEALEKRNYITHHFFRHHNFAIHSEEGRQEMISELTEIGKKLDVANVILDGLSSTLFQFAGRPHDFGMEEGLKLEARGKRVKI